MTPRAVVFERWLSHAVLWCCRAQNILLVAIVSRSRGASRVDDPRARACPFFILRRRSRHCVHFPRSITVPSPARVARAQRRRSLPARRDGFRDARTRCQSLYMVCSAASALVSAAYPATHSRSVASCECRRARRRVASTPDALHQGPDLLSSSTRERTRSRSSSRRVCRARTSRRYRSRDEPGSGCSPGRSRGSAGSRRERRGGRGVLGVRVGACAGGAVEVGSDEVRRDLRDGDAGRRRRGRGSRVGSSRASVREPRAGTGPTLRRSRDRSGGRRTCTRSGGRRPRRGRRRRTGRGAIRAPRTPRARRALPTLDVGTTCCRGVSCGSGRRRGAPPRWRSWKPRREASARDTRRGSSPPPRRRSSAAQVDRQRHAASGGGGGWPHSPG